MAARFDRNAFYGRLNKERHDRGLNWTQVAAKAGVPLSAFTRLKQGGGPSCDALAALLTWIGDTDINPYVTGDGRHGGGR